jgi:hypothetical protein
MMCAIDNFKLRRISRLIAGFCVAFTVSAPFAVAYVTTGNSAPQIEQTSSQIDRSKKSAPLRVSPQQRPVEREGVRQIEIRAPRMIA